MIVQFTLAPSCNKKVKELTALLKPYMPVWNEWAESGACFLSKKEIRVLQNYLMTGSHTASALEFNMSALNAAAMLNRIMFRLNLNSPKFQNWLTERLLEKHGIIVYESARDKFLSTPLAFLVIQPDLKLQLSYLQEYTMKDILKNYTESKLKINWLFSAEKINELKKLLGENNCLDLLR